jgi:hypothetical protein
MDKLSVTYGLVCYLSTAAEVEVARWICNVLRLSELRSQTPIMVEYITIAGRICKQ